MAHDPRTLASRFWGDFLRCHLRPPDIAASSVGPGHPVAFGISTHSSLRRAHDLRWHGRGTTVRAWKQAPGPHQHSHRLTQLVRANFYDRPSKRCSPATQQWLSRVAGSRHQRKSSLLRPEGSLSHSGGRPSVARLAVGQPRQPTSPRWTHRGRTPYTRRWGMQKPSRVRARRAPRGPNVDANTAVLRRDPTRSKLTPLFLVSIPRA